MDSNHVELKGDSVVDRYKYLLECGYNADLTLLLKDVNNISENHEDVESGKKYRVHRILMAASSPVFDRMLFGSLAEEDPVILRETNPQLFPLLLEFVYTRSVGLENCTELDKFFLLEMAHKYMMHDLVELCGTSVKTLSLSPELFKTLNVAVLYNVKSLKLNCSKVFSGHTKCSFQEPEFFSLSPEAMSYIVQLEEMYITSEVEVFLAAVRWAETSLGLKKYVHQMNQSVLENSVEDSVNISTNEAQTSKANESRKLDMPFGLSNMENEVVMIQSIVELDTRYGKLQKNVLFPIPVSDIHYRDRWVGETLTELDETSAEYGPKIRNFLQKSNCFQHIRFLAMDTKQFCAHVLNTKVLTLDEVNYILLYLNSSVMTAPLPAGICTITSPRDRQKPEAYERRVLCVATVAFQFLTPHWFEVVSFIQFKEVFYCSSNRAICLETVTLPSKEKKHSIVSGYYDEEVSIELEFVNEDGTKINTIASCSFKGKRKYQEDKAFPLVYSMSNAGSVLTKGMYFSVGVSVARTAMYLGGFQYSQRCIDNDFIQVSETKAKGIIKGFSFSFRL